MRKTVRFDGFFLYIKENGTIKTLGKINTRNGGLTKEQKLRAVQFSNEWVEV
jgi:hypothetical protein